MGYGEVCPYIGFTHFVFPGLEPELSQTAKAIYILSGTLREVKKTELDEFPDNRALVVIDKVSHTPAQYPRRAGMPVKRPLC